jgi:UDP-N-acetylmuramyl pentapeptide phosphotransferase/UDP-N-acetylglucosamine-1-phosphate transferase
LIFEQAQKHHFLSNSQGNTVPDTLLYPALGGFLSALVASILLAITVRWHGRLSLDEDSGAQKHHANPTPRIGGIAIFAGLATALALTDPTEQPMLRYLLLGLPALIIGLAEDVLKTVRPRTRLVFHFIAALSLTLLGGQILRSTGWHVTDAMMAFTPFAVLVTAFGLAGVTNAVNLIDGYNGLASGSVVIMAIGLGALALRVDDAQVFQACIVLASIVAGFAAFNFVTGKLFLGDGGAYYLGFMLAALALMLCVRHPDMTPWAPLMVIFYPVWETAFSIIRKSRRIRSSPSTADGIHMHHLVSRTLARPLARGARQPGLQNPLTSLLCWPFAVFCSMFAVYYGTSTIACVIGMILFGLIYENLYQALALKKLKKHMSPAQADLS